MGQIRMSAKDTHTNTPCRANNKTRGRLGQIGADGADSYFGAENDQCQ